MLLDAAVQNQSLSGTVPGRCKKMSVPHHKPRLEDRFLTRRDFLTRCGMGFGMLSLANLLAPEARSATLAAAGMTANAPWPPRAPHFPPNAKRVIPILATAGPSHVDTSDPKPILARLHGQP